MANTSCVLVVIMSVLTIANVLLLAYVGYQSLKSDTNEDVEFVERFSKDDTYDRVISGRKIPLVNYKFVAAVVVLHHGNKYDSDMVICGAAIISRYWVLTAAHCTELLIEVPVDNVRISANSSIWQNGVWHKVKRIIMHENYDGFSLSSDISLISVVDPFTGVFEASIPLAGSRYKYTDNTDVTVIGWSATKSILYGLDMQMYSEKFCKGRYYQVDVLSNGVFCAGTYKRKPSCLYDFGGPVVQRNVLIGIVCYRGDCERNRPGIYTKVSQYESWFKYLEKRYKFRIGAKYA